MPGLIKMCDIDGEKMCKKYPGVCNKEEGTYETNVCKYEREYCNANT